MIFFICFGMMKLLKYTKVRLVIFPKKSSFGQTGILGPICSKIMLPLMISCKDFLKHFIIMKQKWCTKERLSNFPLNIRFWDQQAISVKFDTKLWNLTSHDPMKGCFWDVLARWRLLGKNEVGQFSKKIPFWGKWVIWGWPIWYKIMQPYISGPGLRMFLKHFSMMVHIIT